MINVTNTEPVALLIWESVPESVLMALIPMSELDEEDIATLRTAHGHYVGLDNTADVEDALNCLSSALCPKPEWLDAKHPPGSRWAMRFAKFVVDDDKPIEGVPIVAVYRAGHMM